MKIFFYLTVFIVISQSVFADIQTCPPETHRELKWDNSQNGWAVTCTPSQEYDMREKKWESTKSERDYRLEENRQVQQSEIKEQAKNQKYTTYTEQAEKHHKALVDYSQAIHNNLPESEIKRRQTEVFNTKPLSPNYNDSTYYQQSQEHNRLR